jgi:hypothetical protein
VRFRSVLTRRKYSCRDHPAHAATDTAVGDALAR